MQLSLIQYKLLKGIHDLDQLLLGLQLQGSRTNMDGERNCSIAGSVWGISSIFSGNENHVAGIHATDNHRAARQPFRTSSNNEPVYGVDSSTIIHLREPPTILRSSRTSSEQDATEIGATKLLLTSYFDIVRKNIEDLVPKAIVNHTKWEMHNVLIKNIYRENLLEEMLQEPEEIAVKRKRARETLQVLQQAFETLDELLIEADAVQRGDILANDSIGLPRTCGLPSSLFHITHM